MEIVHYKRLQDSPEQAAVAALIARYSGAFVPPLAARASTTDQQLGTTGVGNDTVADYVAALAGQPVLVALAGTQLLGMMSYKEAYTLPVAGQPVATYVSTVIVDEAARGHQLTEAMYRQLFALSQTGLVATRTWSTNHAHLRILAKMGFHLLATLPNDRGAGIDTVYYGRTSDEPR